MSKAQSDHFHNTPILSNVLLALLIIVLALIVLSQANPGLSLPDRDYGIFSYIGQQIVLGKLPYKDAWDHKPPAVFYADALGLWMAHGLRWGIWAIEFLCLAAAIWLSYILIKKLWGVFPALCAIAIWTFGLNITLQGGNTTEEFPLPLHFLALILFLRLVESPETAWDGLFIGLAFSVSFLFRANNAMIETAVVLTLWLIWIFQRNFLVLLRQMIGMALGALLPTLLTSFYFWRLGLFKAMFDASITYNVIYSETKFNGASALIAGLRNLGLVAWVGLIGYGVVLFLLIRHWRAKTKPPAMLILLLIGCPFAVAVTDPAQRNYAHYFANWLPFIALLTGLTFYSIQHLIPRFKELKLSESYDLGFALVIAIFYCVLSGLAVENWTSFVNLLNRSNVERDSVISVYVENNTKPGDTVIFWGGFPGENLMSQRASPTAYITYPLLLDANISETFSDQFFRDLKNNRPALIVDMEYAKALSLDPEKRAAQLAERQEWPYLPANIEDVLSFIDNNYHPETTFRNAKVYRLNGTTGP
ncbi:MAG TPA: glycosyltransferase family 39 protein [Anaerolineales bacterium]|nr:glycosyltransferase family 39 protein [Anaerolineales bacterium]